MPYQTTIYRRPPDDHAAELDFLLFRQDGVLSRPQALRFLTPKAVQHRLESGRWRQCHRGVYLTHNGPLTREQQRWIAVLAVGAGRVRALLGGLSALELHGFRGFREPAVHVLVRTQQRDRFPPPGVRVHRTLLLTPVDIYGAGTPPCTTPARSLVDAAQWAATDDRARAIVAAGFQQRLVNGDDMTQVLARLPRARRRALVVAAVADACVGAHARSESDFLRLCRRAHLPTPVLQVRRDDASGRRRYLDAYFERWRVHVEIDGAHHMDVGSWWADMKRQNDIWVAGDRVLRFPAWALRHRPEEVVTQLRAALRAAGWNP